MWKSLSSTHVVLVCDDSGSMASAIADEKGGVSRSTRWAELKRLAAEIITIITTLNPEGIDIHFFNRPALIRCMSPAGLSTSFGDAPSGGTPLVTTLETIVNDNLRTIAADRQLLVVAITDGAPSGGPRETKDGLFSVLQSITRSGRVHVSMAECTDRAEDMEYLDAWDGVIKNFDNTDDYREELTRVRATQGATFKFDYSDYVCKILLATFDRWFFNLDQSRVGAAPGTAPSAAVSAPYVAPYVSDNSSTYPPKPASCCVML